MNTKVSFVFSLALGGLIMACGGESVRSDDDTAAEPGDGNTLTRDDVRGLGKSDWPVDYCEAYGWYGDGVYCDDFCPLPDPDCASSCSDLGGTCMTDPADPGFPALCEDLGLKTVAGSCEAFNEACCVPSDPTNACEAQGGTCMTDPGDPTFPAICENLGMQTLEGGCEAFNEACCAPVEEPPPETCEAQGGTCMSDPLDVGFAANCEELGMKTFPGTCEAFNHSCCGPAETADCESLGGTCMSDPTDPGFAADCEELGMETVPGGTCEAFNQTCCEGPIWYY